MRIAITFVVSLLVLFRGTSLAQTSFTAFESGAVRPLALSPTGD